MKRLTIAGIMTSAEIQTSNNGVSYLKMSIEEMFIKKDGQPQIITNYITIFSEFIMNDFNKGYYQIGNALIGEGTCKADAYTSKEGEAKSKLEITLSSLTNLNLASVLNVANANQQPVNNGFNNQAQPQQVQPNLNIQQPPVMSNTMFSTQPNNGFQPNNNQPVQSNNFNNNNNSNSY